MKNLLQFKIIILVSACQLTVQNFFAQTLTCQTSCPKAGEVFSMRTASPVISSPGPNQLWNFSSVYTTTGTFLLSYSTASTVPSSSLYPQANLVITKHGINTFLEVGNAGIRATVPITSTVNTQPMALPLPYAYGDTVTETIISTSVSGTDTFVTAWENSFVTHGSGTLILPSGTFTDVLAIKFKSTQSQTKNGLPYDYIYYTTYYYYYSLEYSHPVLNMRLINNTGPGDFGPQTEFIDHVVVVGDKENYLDNGDEMLVSPNPAGESVNIRLLAHSAGKILVKNSIGQQLKEEEYENGKCSINISDLPEGIYVVSFVSDTYKLNRKLIVKR